MCKGEWVCGCVFVDLAGVDAKRGDKDKHHESNCSCVVKSIFQAAM